MIMDVATGIGGRYHEYLRTKISMMVVLLSEHILPLYVRGH